MNPKTFTRLGIALNNGAKHGWQTNLARRAKVAPRTVRRWLAGDTKIAPLMVAHLKTLKPKARR